MSKTLGFVLGGLLVLALAAAGGLGYWVYQTSNTLQATQKQLAALQAEHDALTAEHTQLTADHEQQGATLDQTKSDLSKAQLDLTAATADKTTLRSKLDQASKLFDVIETVYVHEEFDDAKITQQVKATGDTKLINLWTTLTKAVTAQNATAFSNYLFEALDKAFK